MEQSNDVLSEQINGLRALVKEKFNSSEKLMAEKFDHLNTEVAAIKEQTIKTNGNVTMLKDWKSGNEEAVKLINDLVEWKNQCAEPLKQLLNDREDNNKWYKGIVWKVAIGLTVAAVVGEKAVEVLPRIL